MSEQGKLKGGKEDETQGLGQLDESSTVVSGYAAVAAMKVSSAHEGKERKAEADP